MLKELICFRINPGTSTYMMSEVLIGYIDLEEQKILLIAHDELKQTIIENDYIYWHASEYEYDDTEKKISIDKSVIETIPKEQFDKIVQGLYTFENYGEFSKCKFVF